MTRRCSILLLVFLACGAWKEKSAFSQDPGVEESQGGAKTVVIGGRKTFDHRLWDQALRKFVDAEGLVDYASFSKSKAFQNYLERLSKADAAGLENDKERLAFWINAYNALTIQGVLKTLPQDQKAWREYSIKDQKVNGQTLWKGMKFKVGGGRWSLDEIEHEIIRKQDGLRDPRIHVALVCAARGCPPLWNRAYTGKEVDEQLASAMRRFVKNRKNCLIDRDKRVIRISKVFEWYRKDFTDPGFSPRAESVAAFLAMSVDDPALSRTLRTYDWRLKYFDYDWKLNLQ
ncbi:MAG: DUF547 domain-containing protein [Phycisphaerales bacterium]|nr:DUF547 domain-containing protein [Phycisphaerales bacterium]